MDSSPMESAFDTHPFSSEQTAPDLQRSEATDNQALSRPTPGIAAQLSADPAAPIQCFHSEEKSQEHRNKARAKNTIDAVAPRFNAGTAGHIFDALPTGGGDLDPAHPSGLHAYRAGALPDNITVNQTNGNVNKVHSINWSVGQNAATKDSTMFPVNMPENHVKTLIGLRFNGFLNGGLPEGIYPQLSRDYITNGQEINIQSAGDTVYPTL